MYYMEIIVKLFVYLSMLPSYSSKLININKMYISITITNDFHMHNSTPNFICVNTTTKRNPYLSMFSIRTKPKKKLKTNLLSSTRIEPIHNIRTLSNEAERAFVVLVFGLYTQKNVYKYHYAYAMHIRINIWISCCYSYGVYKSLSEYCRQHC